MQNWTWPDLSACHSVITPSADWRTSVWIISVSSISFTWKSVFLSIFFIFSVGVYICSSKSRDHQIMQHHTTPRCTRRHFDVVQSAWRAWHLLVTCSQFAYKTWAGFVWRNYDVRSRCFDAKQSGMSGDLSMDSLSIISPAIIRAFTPV